MMYTRPYKYTWPSQNCECTLPDESSDAALLSIHTDCSCQRKIDHYALMILLFHSTQYFLSRSVGTDQARDTKSKTNGHSTLVSDNRQVAHYCDYGCCVCVCVGGGGAILTGISPEITLAVFTQRMCCK